MKNDSSVVEIFKFKNGAIGKVTDLYEPIAPYAYANNIAVYGTKGTIVRDMICLDESEGFTKIETTYSRGHPYKPEVNHFIDCILKDKKALIDAREGARSVAGVITVSQSIPIPQF
jgi:predicted dehydrogenase